MVRYDENGEPVDAPLGIIDGFLWGHSLGRYLWWSRHPYRFDSDVYRDMVEARLDVGDEAGALKLLNDWERDGSARRLPPPRE